MIYHLKAYGFLFPIKDAVTILELLPGCHRNMHSGIFGHIRGDVKIQVVATAMVREGLQTAHTYLLPTLT